MASYNQYPNEVNYNNRGQHNAAKKVFINPNFQRNNRLVPQNGLMYLNPNFPKQNILPNQISTRIHVNPNFVKPSTAAVGSYMNDNMEYNRNNIVINTSSQNVDNTMPIPLETANQPAPTPSIAKSRYCIVRKNNSSTVIKDSKSDKKIGNTLKISKYKSIFLEHAKQNFATLKNIDKPLPSTSAIQSIGSQKKKLIRTELVQSRFKLIKNIPTNVSPKADVKTAVIRKRISLKYTKSNQISKGMVNNKTYRKNNIPCPLFKKYGKCLRQVKGHCEFLHDKKHVSLCRKFLKGICHDKDCLLSHEVSSMKMPTCSFYLKGMCTKEDCPYLHVKLNAKAKICADFLKGFCERGDKCLNRHLNVCPQQATKRICTTRQCPYQHKCNKQSIKVKTKVLNKNIKGSIPGVRRILIENSQHNSREGSGKEKDCRYYKVVEDGEGTSTETIKPTRCKLGALPSFIQL